MKVFVLVCVVALVGLSTADDADTESTTRPFRGCIYVVGKCLRECEEGTHAYALGCDYKTPEATCDEPAPKPEAFIMCDYSACYCDEPTLRDTVSGKCVQPSECPKK